jgi:hypothetical protein
VVSQNGRRWRDDHWEEPCTSYAAMLSRYSHVRMEAKRRALDEIAMRQCAVDEKRRAEAERQQSAMASQAEMLQ